MRRMIRKEGFGRRLLLGLSTTLAAVAASSAIGAPAARAATPPATWYAGAAQETITPPPYNPADDSRDFPTCDTAVFSGQRLFDFEEPYQDVAGTGFFDYTRDPYCDANANGRWDGLYDSGGVDHLFTWVHDEIWTRALAISDGVSTIIVESVTSQGLGNEDVRRVRAAVDGYTGEHGDKPPVDQLFLSSTHNESSPDPIGIYGAPADPSGTVGVHSGIDDYYITYLVQRSALAAKEAVDALVPARIRVGEFYPPDVQARLSTTFLTTDSNPDVAAGPTANGTPEATDRKALVLQLIDSASGVPIETMLNWAAHNQQTGHASDTSVAPDPSDGGALKPINRAVSDDWPGVFASALEASIGGRAMFLVGDNGSIEDPHEYPLPQPDYECPPSDFDPQPAHGTSEGCITLPHITGTRLAADVANLVGQSPTLGAMEDVAPHALGAATSGFVVPLQNQLFIAAFAAGLFAHHTAATVQPCVDAEGAPRTCFATEVGLADFGPRLQMLVNPGEAYPALIDGHPFGREQISCPERAEPPTASWYATGAHHLEMGLGDDMLGYEIPAPGWFADSAVYEDPACPPGSMAQTDPSADYDQFNNYHKLESESVGPDTGSDVATHLAMLGDCAAAGTLGACSGTPQVCRSGQTDSIQPGRFLLSDGSFTRKGKDGPVGMWVLPCGSTAFSPGAGRVIALPGVAAFGTTPVDASGVFMDYDGRLQPDGPSIDTRGMLVTRPDGSVTRYFLDPYLPLSGSPPGAAVLGPTVPDLPLPALAAAALPLIALRLRRRRPRLDRPANPAD
jgi:hypothetical protein